MRTKAHRPPLKMPPLHNRQAWSQYHRAIDRAQPNKPDPTDLLTAMRTAAVACGFQQQPHTQDDRPHTALEGMQRNYWETLLHTNTPPTPPPHTPLQDADSPHSGGPATMAYPKTTAHRPRTRAVGATLTPYKAICHLNDAMSDSSHRTITEVWQPDDLLTNGPAMVHRATMDSFLHQHTPSQDTLDTDKMERLHQVFNHALRRQLEKRPFIIHEVQKAIHTLRPHKTPG